MADSKEAWKQWCAEIKRDAASFEAAADAIAGAELRTGVVALRSPGAAYFSEAVDSIRGARDRSVAVIRDRARRLLEEIKIAKWMGDRPRVLEAVSQPTFREQRDVAHRCRLTRIAADAIGDRNLWRPSDTVVFSEGNARIDRIVSGARLYADTRKL